MLVNLAVQNYALIRELNVEFENGLTIITGETGAGKSILLGALGLILGSRADTAVLLDKEEKCIVEGTFRIDSYDLSELFETNNLDYDPVTVLRREINPAGKSRAFINDTPVTLNVMKDLAGRLIDIHSQHQTLMLNDNSFQLNVIDSFAGTARQKSEYRNEYSAYLRLKMEYSDAKEKAEKSLADLEYLKFQTGQLESAKLVKGEQQELESEQEMLTHAEEIKLALSNSSELFAKDEESILAKLKDAKSNMGRISRFLPGSNELVSRISSSLIELDDIAGEIEKMMSGVEADPRRLSFINDRLDTLYSLFVKHHVPDLEGLMNRHAEIRERLQSIETGGERLTEMEKLLRHQLDKVKSIAAEISARRKGVLVEIEEKVSGILRQLGMANAKLRVTLSQSAEPGPTGMDNADFLFSANRQVAPENIARIASGGELSRVMLSLKSLLTKYTDLPTIIFDEIDSGVSGEVADKVGQILSGMGKYMQVVNITHLPQVASRGGRHYHVYKDDLSDSTITKVKLLTPDERIMEVARLLSGSEITDAAIRNARELLESALN
jgi:DNA repair protein RecN (Recombination protein N)